MRAVQLNRFGTPEVLEVIEMPTPAPGRGEVLVRIHAVGINFFEVLMRADRYAVSPELPMVMGVEATGVVESLGDGVTSPDIGARVAVPLFAVGRTGGYADYVAVSATSVALLPETLSFEDAVAMMVQGLTALHLVRQSPPTDRAVLVSAAAGGVGSLLVQLARQAGAKSVIAAASTGAKRDLACALGADTTIDYTGTNWADEVRAATGGRGADIIYDMIGGAFTKDCLGALAPDGELVFGALGRFALGASDMEGMFEKNQSMKGFALLPLLSPDGVTADLSMLFEQAARGDLTVIQGGRYRLDQVADAHRALESRGSNGKIVLIP